MGSQQSSKLSSAILRASVLVVVGHVLFKVAGLAQAMVMGRALPKETYDVVYGFAFEKCIFAIFLVGEQVIGPALMPLFMRELDSDRGERSAWSLAHVVLWVQAIVLAIGVALLVAVPEGVVGAMTRWTTAKAPEAFDLAVASVRSLSPALVGLSLASTTYVILNAYKRFFLASFADAAWKFSSAGFLLAALLVAPGRVRQYLVAGLLAGSVLKLSTHLVGLRDKRHLFAMRPDFRHPALRDLGKLMVPLLVGVVFATWRDVFNDVTVLSGLRESGLIQANSMGRKLQGSIAMLLPYTLSIAMFPFLCELVDRRDNAKLGELLTKSGRMLLILLLPLAAVVAVVAKPLTALLFKGGQFGDVAVSRTALSTLCYTFVLPASAIEMLLMQAFFAHRRMVSVTVAGIVFSLLSMGISYWAVVAAGWQGSWALVAVAGGFTLSRWLKTLALVVLLRRDAPVFPTLPTTGFLARTLLVSGLCAGAAYGGVAAVRQVVGTGLLAALLQLAVAGTMAAAGFVAGCALIRVREPREMLDWALARLRRKQAPAAPADGIGA